MDNFQKYSRLMLLIAGGFVAFILFIALVFFLLRLFSITMVHIPGFNRFFEFAIVLIPYIIFFTAYYYLSKKIRSSKNFVSRMAGRILLIVGALLCVTELVLSLMVFFEATVYWLRNYEDNVQFGWIIQLIILMTAAAAIAGGDAKEKDWMERRS